MARSLILYKFKKNVLEFDWVIKKYFNFNSDNTHKYIQGECQLKVETVKKPNKWRNIF